MQTDYALCHGSAVLSGSYLKVCSKTFIAQNVKKIEFG